MRLIVQPRTQTQCTPKTHLRSWGYAGEEQAPALWRRRGGAEVCHSELPRLLWLPWSPANYRDCSPEHVLSALSSEMDRGICPRYQTIVPDVLDYRSFDLIERCGALSETLFVFSLLIPF